MKNQPSPYTTFFIVSLLLIAAALVLLLYLNITTPIITWILALSLSTFILYGYDKYQAPRNGRRVPEIVLHILALVGGFPGGWLGMGIFDHKKRNVMFWLVLIATTLGWGALALYLMGNPQS